MKKRLGERNGGGETRERSAVMNGTVKRALVHICLGLAISVLAFFLKRPVTLALIGTGTFCYLLVDLFRLRNARAGDWFARMFKPFMRDYERSRLTGASYFLVASLASLTLFNRETAILAISFLTLGDSLATIVSERYGKIHLPKKTLEGMAAGLAANVIIVLIWRYAGLDIPLALAFTGAAVATIVESLPLPVDDNLTIPILSGAAMWLVSAIW
jgi:glycerol-3-phosphate acyltransferase PlsY